MGGQTSEYRLPVLAQIFGEGDNDTVYCPGCATEMQEETRHGVTIDWCSKCGGMWFDIEEIQKYLNARGTQAGQPVPKENELRASRAGQPEKCTCCEERQLYDGTLRGFAYQRCFWCGGVYLSAAELAKIQSRETTSTARPPLPPGQKMLALGDSVDLLEVALHVISFLFS